LVIIPYSTVDKKNHLAGTLPILIDGHVMQSWIWHFPITVNQLGQINFFYSAQTAGLDVAWPYVLAMFTFV
jgi:hypothetical protein